ncbi:MAG: phage tail tape measure protein [Bacteroidales bacterium]|nr:phage tail tape measure protein [Bacteroidales bacterium]
MANVTSSATVNLNVNGQNAQQQLDALQKKAEGLRKTIDQMATAGKSRGLASHQRELAKTEREIRKMQSSLFSVQNTLNNLSSASISDLNKALSTMNRQLKQLPRNSQAWNEMAEKIRRVKEELNSANEALRPEQSMLDRFNEFFEQWQNAFLTVCAVVSGLVMMARNAVGAFAGMDQEMANVRKYTGMSAEEVASLNEELLKIDTRTSRADLNKLAQEAGRLGKTSQEDVLGFVRAADKINVALDDLGEGATLTLSKLTGIFGDEKRLGTERALLSVGSVINELSQNCSASAPYLAEFASRVGGVGAQAGLTVPQIMGFAAVLDSNNQKLEASATALSQVIVRIYQDPTKYARVAGINVKKFSELVKSDMNAALVLFLSTLNKAGSMDTLSPMFKDMGENGSRAISALSTLSAHISEVKDQQKNANIAFREANSIDQEFNVQNSTLQASLDKAKNRINELAISLGEQLAPVMRHIISSTTILLRVVSTLISFISNNAKEFATLTVAIVAYTIAINGAAVKTALLTAASKAWVTVQKTIPAVLALGRVAFAAAANAVQYFTNGLEVNYAMQLRWRNAMSAIAALNPATLFVTLTVAAVALGKALMNIALRYNQQAQALGMLDQIRSEATVKLEEERQKIVRLIDKASDLNTAEEERAKIVAHLNSIIPEMNAQIDSQTKAFSYSTEAVENHINALKRLYEIEGAKSVLKDLYEKRAKLAIEESQQAEKVNQNNQAANYSSFASGRPQTSSGAAMPGGSLAQMFSSGANAADELALSKTRKAIASIDDQISVLYNHYGVVALSITDDGSEVDFQPNPDKDNYNPGSGLNPQKKSDRFAEEKAWREYQEAMARISYATGESDYSSFTRRMNEIQVEFYRKQLEHSDLSEQERTKISADWREAQKKQQDRYSDEAVESIDSMYSDIMANLAQSYLDGTLSKQSYDQLIEEMEIEHQQALVAIADDGSSRRQQAEKKLQSLQLAQMERRRKEHERLEEKYASMKSDFFGDNPAEAQAKYNGDLELLKVVYDREIQAAGDNAKEKLRIEEAYQKAKLALMKKYGILSEAETKISLKRSVESSVEWLNSDEGNAVTKSFDAIVSGMSAIFSQLSSSVQAELELTTAKIEKRYKKEADLAEGNAYLVKQAEIRKERDIAKAKSEANKKLFAMQVFQAVASTAQGAINAYSSAAAIPVVGHILAPIAAGMAVAAGAIQIATIKKQQQASEAQGYMEGGFTAPGDRRKVVGVVHAGEWVAPQSLVNNPATRPMIDFLENARRSNPVGSLSFSDVSARVVPAQKVVASGPEFSSVRLASRTAAHAASPAEVSLSSVLSRLNERLSEPIGSVTTVAGDYGINRQQERYARLLKNKSPKSR